MGVLAIGIVLPFNYTASDNNTSTIDISSYINRFSIASIKRNSNRLYIHLLATIGFSLFYVLVVMVVL